MRLYGVGLVLALLALLTVGVMAAPRRIVIGEEDDWAALSARVNLSAEYGYRGGLDLRLQDARYRVESDSELLMRFDDDRVVDEAGRYRVVGGEGLLTERIARLGAGSALFRSGEGGITLAAETGARFLPGAVWDDFSIEFWLYAAHWDDGDILMFWRGSRFRELRASLQGRRVVWELRNLFDPSAGEPYSLDLVGARRLLPRRWQHHLLRYDSRIGLVEYLLDGIPEAIVYATDTGGEPGSIYPPRVGDAPADRTDDAADNRLTIGSRFTGFIDELRIMRRFVRRPILHTIGHQSGYIETEPFDLGAHGGRLMVINARYETPGETQLLFSYRLGVGLPDLFDNRVEWRRFQPGIPFEEPVFGRYLIIRSEFRPDGGLLVSPLLSNIVVEWRPQLPPTAPINIAVEPLDGAIRLSWRPATGIRQVGYRVYWGLRSREAPLTDGAETPSTIDIGIATTATVSGLEPGRLYYFSVESYPADYPGLAGALSAEIAARPVE